MYFTKSKASPTALAVIEALRLVFYSMYLSRSCRCGGKLNRWLNNCIKPMAHSAQ